jgi:hypothetical protein
MLKLLLDVLPQQRPLLQMLLLLILLGGSSLPLSAQSSKQGAAPKAQAATLSSDSLSVKADSTRSRLWIVGASWGNNSSFLGRYQAERIPFYALDATYKAKSGFWISGIGYHIPNTINTLDELDVMVGWSFDLSKRWDASVYYSRFFFSPESPLLKAATANAISGRLGLDWGLIYTQLTPTLTFGGSSDVFLVLDNSRYFEVRRLFHKKDYISIEPRISLIAGTQSFVESYTANQPAPIFGPGPGKPGGGTQTREYTATSFSILAYELSLPVGYTYKRLTLEATPRYNIPMNQLEGDASQAQFFLTTSLFLSLKK